MAMGKKWFDESDNMRTIKDHLGGKHTPDSIRDDAKREYSERRREEGASEQEIRNELFDLEY
jgi:hypothetical protein